MRSLIQVLLFFLFACGSAIAADLSRLRGVNVASNVGYNDLLALKKTGANVIRVSFSEQPIVDKVVPYGLNGGALQRLDEVLDWCERLQLSVIVDPHTYPGTKSKYSTHVDDLLWVDSSAQDAVVEMWTTIARRYKNKFQGKLFYDILNEPTPPLNSDIDRLNYRNFLIRIISAIRSNDEKPYLVVESVTDYKEISKTEIFEHIDTKRVVFSMHFYEPDQFTHQGVYGKPVRKSYPGYYNGKYYDKRALSVTLQSVQSVQRRFSIPVIIGEFSASRFGGLDAENYLRDAIDIFESKGWSWMYHSYREAAVWDAEMKGLPNSDDRQVRDPDSPRMRMLSSYFKRN